MGMDGMNTTCISAGQRSALRSGFTLVELLTGIAVLTVLFGLIVGAVSYARNMTQQAARINRFEQRTVSPTMGISAGHTPRVLFIGNSLTADNNLPALVQALVEDIGPGMHFDYELWWQGGWTLQNHWEDGTALQLIQSSTWDFVVLQEQGTLPNDDPDTFYTYVRLFSAAIKAQYAVPVLYQTMARQTLLSTQAKINQSYFHIAKELGIEVAPVGVAYTQALTQFPNWTWYQSDQVHPSPTGSYLGACVFYSTFYNQSATGGYMLLHDDNIVMEVAPQNAPPFVQKIAWTATKASRSRWMASYLR
jgi:prepilin-type N-terminal cleavage/methylation domain-containing protein